MKLASIGRRLRHIFERNDFARDLNEEMRLHVELRARKLRERGVDEREATYMALRQFGNRAQLQDVSSALWSSGTAERLWQDLRLGARTLRKTPGFTAIAVLTLALGLGINTAVFSVVNTVMIRSLPYPAPSRLIALWEEATRSPQRFTSSGSPGGKGGSAQRTTVSVANLLDYQKETASFSGLAAYDLAPMNLTGLGTPLRIQGERVTSGFFGILEVKPLEGRDFVAADEVTGAPPVVILTYGFWQQRLGGDTAVLEHSVTLDGQPRQVIGVLPRGFQSPAQLGIKDPIEFYVPAAYPKDLLYARGDHEVNVVGRLTTGASVKSAQSALDAVSNSLGKQFPSSNGGMRAVIAPLQADLVKGVTDSLMALLGASLLIVLITCVNVANLLLVRAIGRRHESSVRLALGASRFRMIRQFLAESMLVAAAGCAVGLLCGRVIMSLLVAIAPASIPQIGSVTLDWRVFAVCTLLATITGLAFGIAPAWQASQTKPAEALKTTGRNTGGKSQARWRASLTVAEVALSLILMVGAGLLLKSFITLMGVDLGFQPDRVVVMGINLPTPRYNTQLQRLQFYQQVEERVKGLPGVQSVAYANRCP